LINVTRVVASSSCHNYYRHQRIDHSEVYPYFDGSEPFKRCAGGDSVASEGSHLYLAGPPGTWAFFKGTLDFVDLKSFLIDVTHVTFIWLI
jgi:hypothetical protein